MDKQKLINKLNEDLSNELSAIIQYITYSAQVTGPFRPQLASFPEGSTRRTGSCRVFGE